MENANARLVELEAKDSLTDAEMQELIMLKPGKIVELPGLQTIGVSDLNQAMANLVEIANRSKHALQHNCYIVVISLRLQHIEVFLRIYWVAQNRYGKIYTTGDKRTFGQVIEDCASVGMRKELVTALKEFNRHRINVIHKYLLGATNYEQLRAVCEQHANLVQDISLYVAAEIGKPLS